MHAVYQEQLLTLARYVRALPPIAAPDLRIAHHNPVCGDKITLSACLSDGALAQTHIAAEGCALCEAGAGLWLQLAEGKMADDLLHLADDIDAFLKQGNSDEAGPFAALTPILTIKNRHKCVALAFEAGRKLSVKMG